MRSILEQLGKELLHCNKMNSSVRNIVEKRCQQYSGLPCELVDIKYAPFEKIAKGYRNKCEFTIGNNFSLSSPAIIHIKELFLALKYQWIVILYPKFYSVFFFFFFFF